MSAFPIQEENIGMNPEENVEFKPLQRRAAPRITPRRLKREAQKEKEEEQNG